MAVERSWLQRSSGRRVGRLGLGAGDDNLQLLAGSLTDAIGLRRTFFLGVGSAHLRAAS